MTASRPGRATGRHRGTMTDVMARPCTLGGVVTAILGLHFGYLAFLVLGGFLTWRWPWMIWPHLVAVGWGVAIVVFSLNCPLTWLENWARQREGRPPAVRGFIDRYIDGVIYPARYVNEARLAVAVLVLVSWTGGYLRWRARRRRRAATASLVGRPTGLG
jgi:Protein of Unknown function (DUF2784)